jgi:hypothetical protein
MHIFIHNTGDPIQGPSGLPAADCVIVATLTDTATGLETSVWDTIDNDLIASTEVSASCDANGEIILENGVSTFKLWPNDRGDKPTHYVIKAPLGEFNTFNAIVLSSPATQTLIQIAAQVTPLTTQELSALATHASNPVHDLNTTVLNKITEANSLPMWNGDSWPGGGGGSGGVTDHNYLTNKGTNTHSQIDTALTRLVTTSGTNTGDQTIPTTLPASDVSAWAKASTKPTYTASEVGADVSGAAAAITLAGLGGVSTSDSRLHAVGSDNQDLSGFIPKNLATTTDMSLVSSGIGTWIAKTLSEFKTWLGLGSAAYTASTAYATAAQGTDSRPASDVYAWAKAATKPVYNNTEVGADAAGAAAAITLVDLGGITSADAIHPNTTITPGTKTKISYDAKGLVTAGADATAADVGAKAIAGVRHVFWPAGAMTPRGAHGTAGNPFANTTISATNKVTVDSYDFDSGTNEFGYFQGMIEHWDGSHIHFKPVWKAITGTAGQTVKWYAQGIAFADSADLDQAYGTAVSSEDTYVAVDKVMYGPTSAAITIANAANGLMISLSVYRNRAESTGTTLAGDAQLLGVMIEYTEASTEEAAWT